MKKFLPLICALAGFSWPFVCAADLQNTQCYGTNYSNASSVKKAQQAVNRKDIPTAIGFYKNAVNENNPWAKLLLGLYYLNGGEVKQNIPEAVRLIKSAAAQDFGPAQDSLGNLYSRGVGVAQNYSEALRWYKSAASKGCEDSWRQLSDFYVGGKGTAQDYVMAHMWINLKVAVRYDREPFTSVPDSYPYYLRTDADAREWLERRMTPQQLNQAQQLATRCQAQSFKNCD